MSLTVVQKLIRHNRIVFLFSEKMDSWNGKDTYGLTFLKENVKKSQDKTQNLISYNFWLETYIDGTLKDKKGFILNINEGDQFLQYPGYVY